MPLIPLLRAADGQLRGHALVDDEDYGWLSAYVWRLHSKGYAIRGGICMHRWILGLTPGDGLEADHVNGDKLDYRRENLRIVTHAANGQNLSCVGRGVSRYRGVGRSGRRWSAGVYVGGQRYYLGTYETPEEAAVVAASTRARLMPWAAREGLATDVPGEAA